MASDYEPLSLDERIEKNLEEFYENKIVPLKKIMEFVEQYKEFKLSGAKELIELFKIDESEKNSGQPVEVISTHGLPGFFAGKRDADTVMLMLNPGQDVSLANNPITTYDRIKKGINIDSSKDFISTFKDNSIRYGDIDKDRADNFDLKQAAFLKHWDDCGVVIPDSFEVVGENGEITQYAGFLSDKYKELYENKKLSKDDKKALAVIHKEAKRIVLMKKLSMDLVPYASRKFEGISPKKMELLFPYLETLFHEIFEKDRKYVIFCSNFYEGLFKRYNKWNERKWHIEGLSGPKEKDENVLNNSKVYCRPITIKYRKEEEINNRQEVKKLNCSQNAIIAHTFPNQSLPNAYEKMEEYGKFCYEEWNKAFGTDK